MKKKLTLIELNEFNVQLLESAVLEMGLRNLEKVIGLSRTDTFTQDTYDSNFLEPWVQWVSIHTGRRSEQHQIQHLGDVPHLDTPQLWEVLSQRGISSGLWGVMNGSRGAADRCEFFFPDPWTASEPGYPRELSRLLELPRFISKNYLKLSMIDVLRRFPSFFKALFQSGTVFSAISLVPRMIYDLFCHGPKHYVFIGYMDLLSAQLYVRYLKKAQPDFSAIFINSIAHVQHHHWHSKLPILENPALVFTFRMIDQIFYLIGKILTSDHRLLVLNGLSQKNTNDEPTWILYRQKDQKKFLEAVGIAFERVESHMTYDAHIFFKSAVDRDMGAKKLREARVADRPFFLVETYSQDPLKLFYRINFSDELPKESKFTIAEKEFIFLDFFEAIVVRTGKHIPNGVVYSDIEGFPKRLENHEVHNKILEYFN